MENIYEPPVPADADLQDFEFMPLYVRALTRSEFAAASTDAEFRAGVMLWCECWHQVPAGSVPDDDRVLAMLAGLGRGDHALEAWLNVKAGAMRNFLLGRDGRWYHPRIALEAADAWRRKQEMAANRSENRARMQRMRNGKALKNQGQALPESPDDNTVHSTGDARAANVQRTNDARATNVRSKTETETETGTDMESDTHSPPQPSAEDVCEKKKKSGGYTAEFEKWWSAYPRKEGKQAASTAYKVAKQRIGEGAAQRLLETAVAYAELVAGREMKFIPAPRTWLSQGRYDDPMPGQSTTPARLVGRNQFGLGG